ncbi:VOC family protein [Streptomyces sp. NPDC000594]|uniref:VOC family protein n=1 Tax=Streptomyces sp. NPDC000594 TaxID=3154261 RepID=UPI003316FF43
MLSTDFTTGSPNWLDLGSPETAVSGAFYGAVFGWDLRSAGPDAGGYGFFQKDGRTVAAIGPLTEEGASPAWTVYFQSPDAEATAKAVEQAGGRVRVAPTDVMEAGRLAAFTDAQGAEFAVWQPAGTSGLETAGEPHTLWWVELSTTDRLVAYAFYQEVFGWRKQDMEIPGMTYTVVSAAEGDLEDASFGGIAEEGDDRPGWFPYFDTADVDALVSLAQENGGSVLMPAADVPEVGRIAWLADPHGAAFAVIKPIPPASS